MAPFFNSHQRPICGRVTVMQQGNDPCLQTRADISGVSSEGIKKEDFIRQLPLPSSFKAFFKASSCHFDASVIAFCPLHAFFFSGMETPHSHRWFRLPQQKAEELQLNFFWCKCWKLFDVGLPHTTSKYLLG